MARFFRLARIFLILLASAVGAGQMNAQTHLSVQEGPLQKKAPHERFLRLIQGGDGNFYAFKSSSSHYWAFGGEGERSLQIMRLNTALAPDDTVKIKRFAHAGQMRNVYEVLKAPDGIALLCIENDKATGMPQLGLRRPDFSHQPTEFSWSKLADMPGLALGIDKPMLRVSYSPDSNFVLVAWRRLADEEGSDRSLSCMILDRELKVLKEPFSPFKKFEEDVLLREMMILDDGHLLFTAQTIHYGNALTGPGTIGYGILHYAVDLDVLRVIRFTSAKEVPVETRLGIGAEGEILAAGWYLDQTQERREAGVFIGRITGADSLEDLVLEPMEEVMRNALIRRETRNGAVGIRTGFHSTLLCSDDGYAFVLHLRGDLDPGIVPASPNRKANNTLHIWRFSTDYQLRDHTYSGFYNAAREEFSETFSWRPLQIGSEWHALATDFGKVRHDNSPREAKSYLWQIPGDNFQAIDIPEQKQYCVLAPREMVKVGDKNWVALAVSSKRWRLVRLMAN